MIRDILDQEGYIQFYEEQIKVDKNEE